MKPSTRVWLGAFAAFGTVVAHALAYVVLAPDPHTRAELLVATGHNYWDAFAALATGAVVAGVANLVTNQLANRGSDSLRPGFRHAAARLALLQSLLFLALETTERTLFSAGGHLGVGIIVAGLCVQLLVALAIAGFVVGLSRVVESFSRSGAPEVSRAFIPRFVCSEVVHLRPGMTRRGWSLRGPPLDRL